MNEPLLDIRQLQVGFRSPEHRLIPVVRGLDLTVRQGELHSLVGESGSGKTVTSTALMGLLPVPPGEISGGEIFLRNTDLLKLSREELRKLRGTEMAMVFQEPSRYLNPAFRVGEQISEMFRLHRGLSRKEAEPEVLKILEETGMQDPRRAAASFPHELSGGMKQRAMIALAVCCRPSFLIADEPTTALDVTLQQQILKLILQIRDSLGMGILFISHDLQVVRDISDRISVIYAGRIVETAPNGEFFRQPLHPYSILLLGSIPDGSRRGVRLSAISGRVPDPSDLPPGCAFHPRCPRAGDICRTEDPSLKNYGTSGGEPHLAACHMTEVL